MKVTLCLLMYGAISMAVLARMSQSTSMYYEAEGGLPVGRTRRDASNCPCPQQLANQQKEATPRPHRHSSKSARPSRNKPSATNPSQSNIATSILEKDTLPQHICPAGQWACPLTRKEDTNLTKCIDMSQVCDLHPDCDHGEDEDPKGCAFHNLAKQMFLQKEPKTTEPKRKYKKRSKSKSDRRSESKEINSILSEIGELKSQLEQLKHTYECIVFEIDDKLLSKHSTNTCDTLFHKCSCSLT